MLKGEIWTGKKLLIKFLEGHQKCAIAASEGFKIVQGRSGQPKKIEKYVNGSKDMAMIGKKWVTSVQVIFLIIIERTPKQIEDHYMNYLRPEISKEPWCLEEDLMLIQLLAEYGKDWKELEKKM